MEKKEGYLKSMFARPSTSSGHRGRSVSHVFKSRFPRPAPNFDCCFRFHRDSINKLIGTTLYSPPASLWQQRIGRNCGVGARLLHKLKNSASYCRKAYLTRGKYFL